MADEDDKGYTWETEYERTWYVFDFTQVLRSLAPSITIERAHFCGEYIFCWAMQNGCPCLTASNMAAPWQKAI